MAASAVNSRARLIAGQSHLHFCVRHPRESGGPGASDVAFALDSRLRGNDGEREGAICDYPDDILTYKWSPRTSRHMTERTTVRLPEELLRRAKRKAAAEGRTLTALIEDGLRLITAEKANPPSVNRILPRGSKAKGGLMPGVDLTSFSKMQEADDLEYVARMKRFK